MLHLLAVVTLLAGSVTAGPTLDEAAAQLRRDPVFVHPDAERRISEAEADDIRTAIRDGDAAIFVAVLPSAIEGEVDGGLNALPAALGEAVGFPGTYAVVTGTGFRAASNTLPRGTAGEIATAVFNDRRDEGAAAVLAEFVQKIERLDRSGAGGGGGGDGGGGGFDGASRPSEVEADEGIGFGGLLLLVGIAGGGLYLFTRRRKKDSEIRQSLTGEQEDLRAELAVLADDVMRLEPEVSLKPEARDDYEAGVARFKWAQAAIDAIDSPDDPPRVRRGMAEAQYAMARARAIIRGHEPPPPPQELQRPGDYGEPAVVLDDRRQPVYSGYDGYGGGWGGGGFFGGNGLFTGLLLGQMLGGSGGWGGGFGWGGGGHDHGGSSGGGGGGFFDGGSGGDWGGGGGDFGGGDSGGGDW